MLLCPFSVHVVEVDHQIRPRSAIIPDDFPADALGAEGRPSGASGVKHMLVTEAAAAADRLRFIGRAWAAAAAAPLEDMVEW